MYFDCTSPLSAAWLKWCRKSAEQRSIYAQHLLGYLHEESKGVAAPAQEEDLSRRAWPRFSEYAPVVVG